MLKKCSLIFSWLRIRYYICNSLKITGKNITDSVAQQVEHIPFKDGVLGSNPSWITLPLYQRGGFFL